MKSFPTFKNLVPLLGAPVVGCSFFLFLMPGVLTPLKANVSGAVYPLHSGNNYVMNDAKEMVGGISGSKDVPIEPAKTRNRGADYRLKIGTEQPRTPLFRVNLILESSSTTTTDFVRGIAEGTGEITQAVNPPLDVKTKLRGTYTISPFLVHTTRPISFDLTGYPSIQFPKRGGIGPVILPNVKLNIWLSGYGGKATYEYRTSSDQPWQIVKDVPVTTSFN